MTGHIGKRVLLLASDERDILQRKHHEQDADQDRVTGVTGARLAGPRHARCSLNSEADPMPDDSRDCMPTRPIAALCEATPLAPLRLPPLLARAAAHHGRSPIRAVFGDLPAVRRLLPGVS